MQDWMGTNVRGTWAASKCGLSVARQNGKNGCIEVRELFGMIQLGEKFLHTAHEVKTARKAFLRLASFFENPRKYPELAALVKEIRRTNGQEAIVLTNGGSTEFIARSKGSGRGFTVDTLVLDEAQELSDDALEALKPTISVSPLGNPQTIYTGTPPGPRMNGEVWARLRKSAESGKARRLAFTDFGLAGPMPDVSDRALWYQTNPELGGRLLLSTVIDEFDEFTDEGFARERLCWWEDPESQDDIFEGHWSDRLVKADESSQILTRRCYAVAVSVNREWSSIGVAGFRKDGRKHVELIERRRGTRWVSEWFADKAKPHRQASPIALDGGGPASSLRGALEDEGLTLRVLGMKDVLDACALTLDDVREDRLRIMSHPDLDAAAAGAAIRPVGDRFAFGRRSSKADISPLESVSLAVFAAVPDMKPAAPLGSSKSHARSETADLATMSF